MGNVYFIQADDRVKIGFAADVAARLAQLQTASATPLQLLAVISGVSMPVERRLHRFFAAQRKRGEWFKFSGQLAVLISHVKNGARPISDVEIEHYATLAGPVKKRVRDQNAPAHSVDLGRVFQEVRISLRATKDISEYALEAQRLSGVSAEHAYAVSRMAGKRGGSHLTKVKGLN